MNSSKLYYSTFNFIANLSKTIFSLGIKSYPGQSFLFALFVISGQIGRLIIGYPLGFLFGTIAFLVGGVLDLFNNKVISTAQDFNKSDEQIETILYEEKVVDSKKENIKLITQPFIMSNSYDLFEEVSTRSRKNTSLNSLNSLENKSGERSMASKMPVQINVSLLADNEKKETFEKKRGDLLDLLNNKMDSMKGKVDTYTKIKSRSSELQNNISFYKSQAQTAQKISHYISKQNLPVYVCFTHGHPVMGPYCTKHQTTAPNRGSPPTNKPVYVSDLVARQEAHKKVNSLEDDLKLVTTELNNNKSFYSFFKNLQTFKARVITCNPHDKTNYMHLLTELNKFMPKDEFEMTRYLP
jgi:hypothetical protein